MNGTLTGILKGKRMFAEDISSRYAIKVNSGPHVRFIKDTLLKKDALYAVKKCIEMYFFSTSGAYQSSKTIHTININNSNV
jgi:hypothetical protein